MARGVYPGSFDPFTNGHLDIVKRSLKFTSHVIVAVADNPGKKTLFTKEDRVAMIKETLKNMKNAEVDSFDGLLVEYIKKKKIDVIIRGVRSVADYEFEYHMALTNRALGHDIETVFLATAKEYAFISATLIKEAASLGGDISNFVPTSVARELKLKFAKS